MYTLEEIEQTASAKSWRVFWIWLLVFGLPTAFLTYLIMKDSYLSRHYLMPLVFVDPLVLFSAFLMQVVSRNGWKKKLMEENEYEERQKREEHYQRMEELLEKMNKEKETE